MKYICLIFLIFSTRLSWAQNTPIDSDPDAVVEDTESLDEDEATADATEDGDIDIPIPIDEDATHSLEITFETEVTFRNLATGEAVTSVKYVTQLKQDILILDKRWRGKAKAEIETEVTGQYAGNEFFSCELEVKVKPATVDILTRLVTLAETEDTDESTKLNLKIAFAKDYGEDWYSNCHNTSNTNTFNTIAEDAPEKYNLEALDMLDPALGALEIENFNPDTPASIDFSIDAFDLEDFDLGNIITYTGSGTLTITPL